MQFAKGLLDQLTHRVASSSKLLFHQQTASKVEIKILRRWIPDAGEYGIGFAEVLVLGVPALGHYAHHAGCLSRRHPDVAILDHHTLLRLHIQSGRSELINGGIRLFLGNHVAGENLHGGRALIPEHHAHDCRHSPLVGGAAHRNLHALVQSLIDQRRHPGPQWQLPGLHQIHKQVRFPLVQARHEVLALRFLHGRGPSHAVEVMRHPLFTTPNLQKLPVQRHIPRHLQSLLFERLVEADSVPVALRVHQDAIAIEQQCVRQSGHHLHPPCAIPLQPPCVCDQSAAAKFSAAEEATIGAGGGGDGRRGEQNGLQGRHPRHGHCGIAKLLPEAQKTDTALCLGTASATHALDDSWRVHSPNWINVVDVVCMVGTLASTQLAMPRQYLIDIRL
uniref:Uncharacterized protein n=1 Tax=Physcomitrium patens TaxID=3218 RepID=A0A2K1JXE9_PHYPA|nr:hypothetical protein PHYPA_013323 [Physcomitrium patens]